MTTFFSHLRTTQKEIIPAVLRAAILIPVCMLVLAGAVAPTISYAQDAPDQSAALDSLPAQPAAISLNPIQAIQTAAGNVAGDVTGKALQAILSPILAVLAVLAYIVLQIANFFLWISGTLFNWAVVYLVFQFATTIGSSPGMLVAWGVLRDVANILLLFGFIFMGIVTILDLHDYHVEKAVPKFLIIAVLMNFSLLGVSAIIDGTNILASVMYNQSLGSQSAGQSCIGTDGSAACEKNKLNIGIAGKIAEVSRVGTVLSGGGQNIGTIAAAFVANDSQTTIALIGLAVFVTITTCVLLGGALLLFSRAITLAFLMVTSPIGIVGWAIDPLKKFTEGWWKKLIDNAIFAPVFLLLIFVSLKIAEGVETRLGGNTAANNNLFVALTHGDVSFFGSIIVFGLIIGFMFASLIAAKRFGITFSEAVYTQSVKTLGGTAATLSGAPVWRATIGGGSNAAARAMRRSGLANIPIFGRGITEALDKGATSSFDVRGIGGLPKALGTATTAEKGGHRGVVADKDKKRTAYIDSVAKERKKELAGVEGQISALDTRRADVDVQIENAIANGDTAKAEEQKKVKEDLDKQRDALVDKRNAVLNKYQTPAQREQLARLTAAVRAGDQADKAHEAEGRELDADIEEAENTVARKTQQRDEARVQLAEARAKWETDNPGLVFEESAFAKTLTEKGQRLDNEIRDLQENTLPALAKRKEESIQRRKENGVRLVEASDALRKADAAAVGTLKDSAITEYMRNIAPIAALPIVGGDMKEAITALRAEGLKPPSQRAFEHWIHELQHEMVHEAEEHAGHDEHVEEPAHAPAAPTGGAPSGGGHGGGH